MRRKLIAAGWIIGLLAWCAIANAGTVVFDFGSGKTTTITTTSAQDTAFTVLSAQENAARAALVPSLPAQSVEDYISAIVATDLVGQTAQAWRVDKDAACAAFKALVASGQTSIKTTLAGHNPCP